MPSPQSTVTPLPDLSSSHRPASFPSPTTARPTPYALTPTISLPQNPSPTRPKALFPSSHSPPPLASSSPLSQPPLHPNPSTPSLSIANDPLTGPSEQDFKPRNIVILLDGTGKQFSRKNSNVIKTMSVLEADETQLLYYSSGVGTILPDHASTWGRIRTKVAEAADTALAWNFDAFVCGAYAFLMDFYRAGDKVYIFGFSRGAYTARVLAGMIQKVGLLSPGNHNQIKLAYEVYIRPNAVAYREGMRGDEELSVVYRQIFGISRTVRIEFLGLWDTVSSLGGIYLPRLPYAGNVKSVKFFRHALALDERRARFAPEYRHLEADESGCDPSSCQAKLHSAQSAHDTLHSSSASHSDKLDARRTLEELLGQKYPEIGAARVSGDDGTVGTKYLRRNVECWFMGCHSDVGGGNDVNGENSLSNIPFRWMLREAVRCGLKLEAAGICVEPAFILHPAIITSGLMPTELAAILKEELRGEVVEYETEARVRSIVDQHLPHSRLVEILELAAAFDSGVTKGSKEVEAGEGADEGVMIGPDALMFGTESLRGIWWLLETLVLQTRRYEGNKDTGKDVWRANLGRPRQMAVGQYIHRSVQKRLRQEHIEDQQPRPKQKKIGWKKAGWWSEIKAEWVADSQTVNRDLRRKYEGPRADLPPEWETSWDELRSGGNELVW